MATRTRELLVTAIQAGALRISGGRHPKVTTLRQDASNRSYHRVETAGGSPETLVVMELGDARSEEATHPTPSQDLPFLDVQRYLASGGIPVPRVYEHDREEGLIFLEDLGDITMESRVASADSTVRTAIYRLAIDQLVRIQDHAAQHPGGCGAFAKRFDGDLLRWELDHFREWLLEAQRGVSLAQPDRDSLERAFDLIVEALLQAPVVFVHRDYQSRNLMIQQEKTELLLRVIDFQDALLGPLPYDLVALLRDSYVSLTATEIDACIDHYMALRPTGMTGQAFRRLFDLQTVQRKLKDAGRFVFIERRKTNPSFLPFVSPSLRYVAQALARLPELGSLHALLGRFLPELGPPSSPTGTT